MKLIPTLTGSFHSAATYREVRRQKDGQIGFALFVVVLTTFLAMIVLTAVIHREVFTARDGQEPLFDSLVKQIAAQTPVMTFKDGTLATKDPLPTVIRLSGRAFKQDFKDVDFITIDTTGANTPENMKTPVLFTARVMATKDEKETKIHQLSELARSAPPTMVINHAVSEEFATKAIRVTHDNLLLFYLIADAVLFIFIAIFFFIIRMFMLLALALFGISIGGIMKDELSFGTALGLASVSYTPIALLDTALFLGLGYMPHVITLFIAGCVTLFVAMKCSQQPVEPPAQHSLF